MLAFAHYLIFSVNLEPKLDIYDTWMYRTRTHIHVKYSKHKLWRKWMSIVACIIHCLQIHPHIRWCVKLSQENHILDGVIFLLHMCANKRECTIWSKTLSTIANCSAHYTETRQKRKYYIRSASERIALNMCIWAIAVN